MPGRNAHPEVAARRDGTVGHPGGRDAPRTAHHALAQATKTKKSDDRVDKTVGGLVESPSDMLKPISIRSAKVDRTTLPQSTCGLNDFSNLSGVTVDLLLVTWWCLQQKTRMRKGCQIHPD